MKRRMINIFVGIVLAIVLASQPETGTAGGTRVWELAGVDELSLGEFTGTVNSSLGHVAIGLMSKPIEMKNVGLVWCAQRQCVRRQDISRRRKQSS